MTEYEVDKAAIAQLEEMISILLSYDPKDRLESWVYTKRNLQDTILCLTALGSLYVDIETMERVGPETMSALYEHTKYMAIEWLRLASQFAAAVPTKPKTHVVEEKKDALRRMIN
jgi:hypothetical protein